MPSITDSVNSLLGRGGNFEKLGKAIGVDKDKAELAVGAAAPELVGGLADKASERGGVAAVNGVIDESDTSILDDLGGFFAGKKSEEGSSLLDQIFGADRSELLEGLVSKTGLAERIVDKALPLLAPIVLSVVSGRKAADNLDDEGVVTLLQSEKVQLESEGFLSGSAGKGIAAGAAAGAAGFAAAKKIKTASSEPVEELSSKASKSISNKAESMKDKAKGKAESMKDTAASAKDKAESVKGKAAEAKDAAAEAKDKAAETTKGLKGKADAVSGKAKAAAGDVTDSATEKVSSAKGAAEKAAKPVKGKASVAAGKAGAVKPKVANSSVKTAKAAAPNTNTGGLGWLKYAIGLLALVAVLALLASQCSSDDEVTGADEAETTIDEAADLQASVDSVIPSGVAATVSGDEVTLTGEVESEEAIETIVADVEGVEGVGSVDNQLTVTEEEVTEETEDPSGDLQGLVDAAVPEGVSAAVDGDVVTLTGELASEEDITSAVADVEAIEGVGSVDNQLTVAAEEDEAEDADTGDALSDELDLGNITFDYNRAQLTAEGQAVVDKWATYLEDNADVAVQIVGHTDSDGEADDNLALSQRRAETVKAALEAKGIAADRLTTDGKGEAEPKVENDSEANKETNRRIEFIEQ